LSSEAAYHHIMKMRLMFGIESLSNHELSLIIFNEGPKDNLLCKEAEMEEDKRIKEPKGLSFFNALVFERDYQGKEDEPTLTAQQKRALWERKNRRVEVATKPTKDQNSDNRKKNDPKYFQKKYF
jgi:hypothetical protein